VAFGGNTANIQLGVGRLWYAPLGTAEPTNGSSSMPSAWNAIGYTEEGSTFTIELSAEEVYVAEELDPALYINTKRTTKVKFSMAEATRKRLAIVLGMGAGEIFIAAAKEAVKRKVPFVIFTASGGARMQEGTLSLMQMARTTLALNEVKDAGLPYIVVMTDPTTGGVSASYAMLGDIHIAEPNAMIAFSGRRVIEQTLREVLPPGFQRAEFLMERGMVDMVVARSDLPKTLGSILQTLTMKRKAA